MRSGNPKRGVPVFSRRGIENVKAMLRERFAIVDWQEAREDVEDFLKPGTSLSYFEKDFFSSVVEGLVEA